MSHASPQPRSVVVEAQRRACTDAGATSVALVDLTVNRGHASQPRVQVLDRFNLEFESGTRTALLGPSGCGKTTILDVIAGIISPQSGDVRFDVPDARLAYMFQDYPFLPRMTARNHVAFAVRGLGLRGSAMWSRADALVDAVGLGDARNRDVRALSQGMRARAALATTLGSAAALLLMDEPFGSLDLETRIAMWRVLVDYCVADQPTVVLVTHDLTEAIALADRIIVLSRSPCRIVADRRSSLSRTGRLLVLILRSPVPVSRSARSGWELGGPEQE